MKVHKMISMEIDLIEKCKKQAINISGTIDSLLRKFLKSDEDKAIEKKVEETISDEVIENIRFTLIKHRKREPTEKEMSEAINFRKRVAKRLREERGIDIDKGTKADPIGQLAEGETEKGDEKNESKIF